MPESSTESSDARHFEKMWKRIFAIAGGIGAVGAIAWFLASNLLVTRSEYTVARSQDLVVQASVQATMNQVKDRLTDQRDVMKEQSVQMKSMTEALSDVKIKLVRIERGR